MRTHIFFKSEMGVGDGFCIGKIQEFQDWDKVDDWLSGGGDSVGYAVGGIFLHILCGDYISKDIGADQ